jgi:hypothetical protein
VTCGPRDRLSSSPGRAGETDDGKDRDLRDGSEVGACCQVKLDDGKVVLNHDRGSLDSGTLSATSTKLLGLGAGETIFSCALESPESQAVRAVLPRTAAAGSPATPLGALIEFSKDCRTMDDLRARCAAIWQEARSAEAGGER